MKTKTAASWWDRLDQQDKARNQGTEQELFDADLMGDDYTGRPMPVEPGPCPDADKVRDGYGGWIDPATGKSCPAPAAIRRSPWSAE